MADRIDEKLIKLPGDVFVHERPSPLDLKAFLDNSKFGLVRGLAFESPNGWNIIFWDAANATHEQMEGVVAAHGLLAGDQSIGVFVGNNVETIRSISDSVETLRNGSLTFGYYPAISWSEKILRTEFPRLFG